MAEPPTWAIWTKVPEAVGARSILTPDWAVELFCHVRFIWDVEAAVALRLEGAAGTVPGVFPAQALAAASKGATSTNATFRLIQAAAIEGFGSGDNTRSIIFMVYSS